MAVRPTTGSLRCLGRRLESLALHEPSKRRLAREARRSIATEASISTSPISAIPNEISSANQAALRRQPPPPSPVLATVYRFPTLEPTRFVHYTSDQLQLPLRRDLLHLAVVYEGDNTRQGTASTKTRGDVRGSRHKIRPQKGTGRARLGDKKSPMLRGGGVAHGPHPRDFFTDLPRKMYDRAWRTALSYRYRKGELLLLEDIIDVEEIGQATVEQFNRILGALGIGRANGGSMFVISEDDPEQVAAFSDLGPGAKMKTEDDVDVKDLLTKGKLLIQKSVLDRILAAHSSDLHRTAPKAVYYD